VGLAEFIALTMHAYVSEALFYAIRLSNILILPVDNFSGFLPPPLKVHHVE